MITLHFTHIAADGRATDQQVKARPGSSVMQAAVDAGVGGIAADCGGSLSCGTCHVYVAEAWVDQLPVPGADEQAMLEGVAAERRPGSRLSCQLLLTAAHDGLTVELPAMQY